MFQQDIAQVPDPPHNNDPTGKGVDVMENLRFQQDNDNQLDMQCNQQKIAILMNHHMYWSDSFLVPTDPQDRTDPLDIF